MQELRLDSAHGSSSRASAGCRAIPSPSAFECWLSSSPGPAPSVSVSPSQRSVFAGTKTEWTQAMVACMQKKGVKATFKVDDEGAPTVEVNDPISGDSSAGQVAWSSCRDELPARPEPTSDADFKVMFDNLAAQSKCVQGEGYEVPPPRRGSPSWNRPGRKVSIGIRRPGCRNSCVRRRVRRASIRTSGGEHTPGYPVGPGCVGVWWLDRLGRWRWRLVRHSRWPQRRPMCWWLHRTARLGNRCRQL